jgi:acetyltransferase
MGSKKVLEANRLFVENGFPTYSTPEQAITTYLYMYQYQHNLELLYETPEELPVDSAPPRRPLQVTLQKAARENREILTETEAKQILEDYEIPVVKPRVATTPDEAANAAEQLGYPVVLKILSPQITHKTDAGGVVLDIESEARLREAFEQIVRRAKAYNPKAKIQGVTVQPMVKSKGYEVILGSKKDPLFGPVLLFGLGGVGVEFYHDVAVGLLPLNQTLARRIMAQTRIYQILQKGYRGVPPANLKLLEEVMVRFSQLMVDFPQLKEVDVNPLLIDDKQALALDARVVIDTDRVFAEVQPHEHLVISPYPKRYELVWRMRDGRSVLLRPIKPEDEPMWLEMFQNFSEESIRYRFFQVIKDTPHPLRVRYCNIDYDRELAIVAEMTESGRRRILGVVRLVLEPDGKRGEIAFIVADPWQGFGLGTKMLDYMIEICTDKKLDAVYAVMLSDNRRAMRLMERMGFSLEHQRDGTVQATLNLSEEAERCQPGAASHPTEPSARAGTTKRRQASRPAETHGAKMDSQSRQSKKQRER